MESDRNEERPLLQMLYAHLHQLMEHFDAVEIIATNKEDGESFQYYVGDGCGWARYGAVKDWLIGIETRMKLQAQREFESEQDDVGTDE